MNTHSNTPQWIANIIYTCMGLQRGEKLLVVIAELSIGTNAKARLQGNIITDEKVLGTIHIAIGRNDFIGGINIATTHVDGVVSQPTLEIDGKMLINNGKHSQ